VKNFTESFNGFIHPFFVFSAKSRIVFYDKSSFHQHFGCFSFFLHGISPSHHGHQPPTSLRYTEVKNVTIHSHIMSPSIMIFIISLRVVERVRSIFYHYVIITVIFICMRCNKHYKAWGLCGDFVSYLNFGYIF
jgi:hypothetical protein